MKRWSGACFGFLLLTLTALCASAASPKRVLILDPYGREVAPYSTVVATFRTTLARELGEPVDFYELPLDLARFSEAEGEEPLVTFLEGRIKSLPVDLVVPIGSAALQFAARHRERLFPDTPVLVLAAQARLVPPDFLRTNATLVTQTVHLAGMVEDILQVQPETTNIVVVFGASPLETFWVNECRREFRSFTNRVGFTWLNDLSLEQIARRCAALPPRSFILHGLFLVDAAGIPCEKDEALRRLHQVANAPLFGYYTSELGLGTIGGRLYRDSELGAQGARTAIRILRGERPGSIPPEMYEAAAPIYDWRELHRWGVSEARLPAGSVIRFRQAGFWERYRWPIAGTVLLCLLQAALIVGLLFNRAKRRQREAEAALIADISSKFVNLPAAEVDREITDAERRICELLDLDISVVWQWSAGPPGCFTATHYYSAHDGPQSSVQLSDTDFPWFRQLMLENRIVPISSLNDFPAEAALDLENCRRLGIKSNLCLPLKVGGEPTVGLLSLNTTRVERDWPDALVKRLQLVAQIFTNALARKRADLALRQSEELNRATFEQAAVGIAHVGTEGRWLRVNDRLCAIVGYRRDELLKLTFQDITHPEDLEKDLGLVRQLLSGEIHTCSVEKRYIRKDQSTIWVIVTVSLVRTASGDPLHFIAVVEDITERRRTEDRVRELSLAVQQSPVSVVITDLEGRITYVNHKFSEVSGYSLAECLGQNPRILKSGESPPSTYKDLWACITGGDVWRGEFHNRKKNGDLYWEWVVISPLLDATHKITHFVGVKEDITERKHAEAELLRQRSELAHIGRIGLLGQLASALAHQLSQPLGAILRNAEAAEILLQESAPDCEELRIIVTEVLRDEQRAAHVIDRLRSLLKRRSLVTQPLEMPEVVDEVFSLVHADAVARQVKLTHVSAPKLPPIVGDRIHLQQVLLNLLVNAMDAVEACAPDRRAIQVTVRQTDATAIQVRVSDHGAGIPAESLGRLFEPFFTTKAKGMGMGLAISKTIIEAHKGKLWAENGPDGGACFCFTLPVASGEGSETGDK